MANVLNGNTFYITDTSSAGTASSFINEKDVLVEAFIVSGETAGDITLHDLLYSNGTYSAGDAKVHLNCIARDTNMIYLNGFPIRFPNGIWVGVKDADIRCTLLIKRKA